MQTTIMEMGQPPGEQADAPPTVDRRAAVYRPHRNGHEDKIFDTPVYNYTTEFPYIWEEMRIPVPYNAGSGRAEQILLDAAAAANNEGWRELGEEPLKDLERRYMIKREDLEPKLYYRLTDNWEMTVRFIVDAHEVRDVKDLHESRHPRWFDEAKIEIASGTYEIVGMPELRVRINGQNGAA